MSSFLEKLNQQAAQGNIEKPKAIEKKELPADTEKAEQAPAQASPATSTAGSSPNINTSTPPRPESRQSAEIRRPSYESADTNSGIRSTEHEVEIDRGYGKRNFLRVVSIVLICAVLIAAGVFAFRFFTMIEIPDFKGKTIAEMRKWCIDNNLFLTENAVYDLEVSADYVINQSVEAGTKLSPKTTFEVTYSLGADPSTKIPVPDLMNMTPAQISDWASKNHLSKVNIYEEYSDEFEKGEVTRYSFRSVSVDSTNFKRGDTLDIYVSRGSSLASYNTPNFLGVLKSTIETWCSANNIKTVFTEILSTEVGEGRIISQSIKDGEKIFAGDTIEFIVSAGPGILIPDFSKIQKEDAPSAVSGLSVTVKLQYSMSVPYGGCISQSLAAGERMSKDEAKITVVYSMGKPYLQSLIGMNESALPEFFYEFNRKGGSYVSYTISYVSSSATRGTVVEASHGAELIEMFTHVEIRISLGNMKDDETPINPPASYIVVPDYSKVLKENAPSVSSAVAVVIVMQYSDTVPYGELISQSNAAGSWIYPNDNRITLIYSAGKPYIEDLTGMKIQDLDEIFYEYKKMGANITYKITYENSQEPEGTVIDVSLKNQFILTNAVISITVSGNPQ